MGRRAKARTKAADEGKVTDFEAIFVREYLVDFNGAEAARRAGKTGSPNALKVWAYRALQRPALMAEIARLGKARAERVEVTADDVLRRFWLIATADPNELTAFRRHACRFCWGDGFKYQRTPNEQRRDRAKFEAAQTKKSVEQFDEEGGDGYTRKRDPNPDCPECFGEGEGHMVVRDTTKVSDGARMLYAGTKETRDGLEVKLNSQIEALVNVAKHIGFYGDEGLGKMSAEEQARAIKAAMAEMDATVPAA